MDIEKLIERLNTDAADWTGDGYIKRDLREAADALEKLQAENEKLHDLWVDSSIRFEDEKAENKKLQAELEQVKRERDAAIEDIRKLCPAWKWDGKKED